MTSDETGSVRTDTWVWSVRLFASRSAATAACKGGRVHVNGKRAKPSQPIRVGDRVTATTPGGERVVVVRRLLSKRVGAAVAAASGPRGTRPPRRRDQRLAMPRRDPGAGRPTKRERRALDRLRGL